jgi:hypothetical protein
MGTTQHPSGCARVARKRPRLRVWAFAASGLFIMYAGDRGRMGSTSSNHRCRSSERALGRARVSSEMRRDYVGTARLRALDRRGGASSRGGSTGIPPIPSGPMWDAAEVPPSGGAGATATAHGPPFGEGRPSVARSQTRPKHLAFPRRSGRGRRSGWPARRNVQRVWAARNARQHRERVDPKPKGASSGRAAETPRACNGLLDGRKP